MATGCISYYILKYKSTLKTIVYSLNLFLNLLLNSFRSPYCFPWSRLAQKNFLRWNWKFCKYLFFIFYFLWFSDFIRTDDGHAVAARKRRFKFGPPIRKSSEFRNRSGPILRRWSGLEISRIPSPEPENSTSTNSTRVRDVTNGLGFKTSSVEAQTVRKSKFETRGRISESFSEKRNRTLRSK